MPEITIRRMTMDDVDGVYAVEISTFVDAWSRDAFVSDMKNPVARYLVPHHQHRCAKGTPRARDGKTPDARASAIPL